MNSFFDMNNTNTNGQIRQGGGKTAFTMVEILIIITILAILALIIYLSFQGYSKNSRDAHRITAIKGIESGLDLFYTKSGLYPMPDDQYGTGVIDGVTLNHVGYAGEMIVRQINMNKVPIDPLTNEKYTYGVSYNQRFFQVAGVFENEVASNFMYPSVYADAVIMRLKGNYERPLKYGSGLYNLPSLLYVGASYTGELSDIGTYFLYENGTNLPKTLPDGGGLGRKTAPEVLEEISGKSGLTIETPVTIPDDMTLKRFKSMTDEEYKTIFGDKLGIDDRDVIGRVLFGDAYFVDNTLPSGSGSTGTGTTGPGVSGSFYFSANQTIAGTQVQIVNTCDVNPTSYTSSDESVAYVVGDKIVVVGAGTFTIFQHGGNCTTNSITNTVSSTGTPGTYSLGVASNPQTTYSFGTPLYKGTNGYIFNNCVTSPTSYTSSNEGVAIINGNAIISVNVGTTTITPIGGNCDLSDSKDLSVINPPSTPVGKPNITYPSIVVGMTFTITDDCTFSPTGYASSDESIAIIYGKTIKALKAGTTYISPIGGLCSDNNPKPLTIHPAVGDFLLSSTAVSSGANVLITDTCSIHPSSYTSSDLSVATVHGSIITAIGTGTTNISQVGGSCSDNNPKVLTVGGIGATGTSSSGGGTVGATFTYEQGHVFTCGSCN